MNAAANDYLKNTSERFQKVFQTIKTTVLHLAPRAQEVFEWKMPGWKIENQKYNKYNPSMPKQGTIDPRYIHIFLVERQNGITLHIWNPNDYYGLEKNKLELENAGFKVMRGCLQFNRKSEYPVKEIQNLLEKILKN